jgi:hypothetical protein
MQGSLALLAGARAGPRSDLRSRSEGGRMGGKVAEQLAAQERLLVAKGVEAIGACGGIGETDEQLLPEGLVFG